MKTTKRIISTILVVVMCLTMAPLNGFMEIKWEGFDFPEFDFSEIFTPEAKAATSGYYTYSVSGDKATITDVDTSISGNITIPSTLGGYPVTSIGNSAFRECDALTSVTIGNSVTSIGGSAFAYCRSLTSVSIPDSVTSIGYSAFYDCSALTSVSIPDSVTFIGWFAFYDCSALTSVTIGNSVTSIDEDAFVGCDALTSIIVDENNSNYSSDANGVLFNKNKTTLIQYPAGSNKTAYTIPDSVISIGEHAFEDCSSLTSVSIPDSVTSIGDGAFSGCDALTSVTIGNSVTSIGEGAFYECSSLTSVSIPDSVTFIGHGAFCYCSALTSVTIPDSVTSIVDSAFFACRSLTSVTIPDSVTSIGEHAFYECSSLTSVSIPDSVTSIGDGAFTYCRSFTSVTIPDSVTSIGDDAFYGCDALTSVSIPDSVTSIGEGAFTHCRSLTSVTIPDSVTSIGEGAFEGCETLTSIIVDKNNSNYSSNANGVLFNKNRTTLIQYPAGSNKTAYTIPDSVTSIGYGAFAYCSALTSVSIPDSVTSIGYGAFGGCSSLTSVTIPNSVTSIGSYAFYYCRSLTSVSIPDSVTSIGNYTFAYCYALTSVTIGNSVTSIGNYAFEGCDALTSVSIPDSVTSIGDYAFVDCNKLTDVYYSGTQEQWQKISIGSNNSNLINATIHCNSGYISSENIKEKLDNVIGVDYTFTYNDNYFSNSSYTYNHDLAIMSNCLAISAMIKANSDSYPTCAESFFEKLRFDNYTPYGYGVSPQYNSIACAIASKNLDNTDETIIAIGVRGAGYDSEWGGNFNIGTKEEHEGFRLAKEGVLGYLSEFIKDNKKDFNSNVKFWISGYSRAAATSNLVAAALDEGANGYDYISSLNYGPEDVYAYTFETPIPTRDKNTKNALYNNIFNIINRIDYVPKVAPETWGYSRYGVDCFLPSPETYGKEYSTLFNKMKAQHKAINGKDYTEKFTFYDAKFSVNTNDILNSGFDVSFVSSNGNVSQSRYLDEFITIFAKYVLKNVETYTNKYQSSIQKLMISALGGGFEEVKIPENTNSEIRSALFEGIKSKIFNMNNSVWRSSLATIISNIEEINLTYTDAYNLLGIVDEALITSIGSYNYVYTLIENASDIMPAHFPEMNFAWLTALDGETIKQSINGKYYRVIKYNCPIDIKLYDEDDNLLATICGDNIEISEDCYLSIYIDADGQKCFCLPEDTEYRFEIIGTDEGTMNCSFSEYDFTKGENTETVNYYDIPVKEDTTFVVELDRKEDNDNNESFSDDIVIVNENEEVIDSDEIITEEKSTEITVTVISNSENSVAVGGGYYKKGEFAKIETLSNGNEVFVGWYVNDNLLSTESTCRFMPENDCVIIAKWTSYCTIHGHTDSEWIVDKDSTCSAEGSKHIECTVCEEVLKTAPIAKLPHKYSSVVTAPTCTTEGYTTYTCECGDSYVDNITGLADHTDGDGDEFCDYCDEFLGVEEDENSCSHICHKDGFMGFIWKIVKFFWKLFGMNPVCECGAAHY